MYTKLGSHEKKVRHCPLSPHPDLKAKKNGGTKSIFIVFVKMKHSTAVAAFCKSLMLQKWECEVHYPLKKTWMLIDQDVFSLLLQFSKHTQVWNTRDEVSVYKKENIWVANDTEQCTHN